MANEINKKLNRLAKKELELARELKAVRKEIEFEREKRILKRKEEKAQPKRRNFVRELKQGGVSVVKIARETGISYYKARQIKLGKKILKSNTPEYRKLRNLHRRIGYQQLRAKGVSAKDAQRLRRDKLRLKPILKKKRADFEGYFMEGETITRLKTNEVFVDKFTSAIIIEKDKEKMRDDIIRQAKIKYGYDADIEIIKEVITKNYEN